MGPISARGTVVAATASARATANRTQLPHRGMRSNPGAAQPRPADPRNPDPGEQQDQAQGLLGPGRVREQRRHPAARSLLRLAIARPRATMATIVATIATFRAVSAASCAEDTASSVRALSAVIFAARSAFDGASIGGNIASPDRARR